MIGSRQRPTPLATLVLLAFILAGLPIAAAVPAPAYAQGANDEISDDEVVFIDGAGFVRVLDIYQKPGSPEVEFKPRLGLR